MTFFGCLRPFFVREMLMDIENKIRTLREINQWSQEDMADKMQMSVNAYARLERGQTKINLERLQKIAEIFNMNIIDLLNFSDKNFFLFIEGNGDDNDNTLYYGGDDALKFEIEKLKLSLKHKDELIQKQTDEIQTLREVIYLFKDKTKD